MMLKNNFTFSLILYFFLNPLISQEQSKDVYGEIYYSVNSKEFSSTDKNSKVAKDINHMLKKVSDIELILTFNNQEALFFQNKSMLKDDKVLERTLAKAASGGDYYTNLRDSIIINKRKVFGEEFLINLKSFYHKPWKITGNKKKINGFLCLEATKKRVIKNSKGTFIFDVVAWFTPDIPASFGPKDAAGLPGLILEFNDSHFNYVATKIELNKIVPKIISFKGKVIDEDKYLNLVNKVNDSYKNSIKN